MRHITIIVSWKKEIELVWTKEKRNDSTNGYAVSRKKKQKQRLIENDFSYFQIGAQ